MRNLQFAFAVCAIAAAASGCGAGHSVSAVPGRPGLQARRRPLSLPRYVIVIVQENRSVDNLFQTQPGVDTQSFGMDSNHKRVDLTPIPLGSQWDCNHSHTAFVNEVTEGFDQVNCGKNAPRDIAFSYVNPADITQYTDLATQYAFADHVLQSNEGPTFPAHLYLIAATSVTPGSHWNISENDGRHTSTARDNGHPIGCDSPPGRSDTTIDMTTKFPGREGNQTYPCIDALTIFDELDSAQISWKYYTGTKDSLGDAPYAIRSLYDNDRANIIIPETTVLSDIENGTLAQVSYVMPSGKNSDHPGNGNVGGPKWVASIVNALGGSNYWNQCAIVVVWDDWGGWFDHYAYRHPLTNPDDPYEYGLRVPLLAIGPFAKSDFVDHTDRDFAAIPHFIEDVYGLPSLGALDSQTDDLFSMFNFDGKARKFRRIPTGNITIESLIHRPPDLTPIDSQ